MCAAILQYGDIENKLLHHGRIASIECRAAANGANPYIVHMLVVGDFGWFDQRSPIHHSGGGGSQIRSALVAPYR